MRNTRPLAWGLLFLVLATSSGRAKEGDRPTLGHVVLIILGGGVRSRDMLDGELMPTLAAMADEGVVVRGIRSGAIDGYDGAARILTGRRDALDGATRRRPAHPTLCEYVRRALALPREKVWYVSHAGADDLHLAWSTHADYGANAGPSVAHGQGAFAEPLRALLERLGRPVPVEAEAWPHLRRLRLLSRNAQAAWLPADVDAGLPRAELVERALLRELDRRALLVRGSNPRDERALRAARTVLAVHRPALTVVRLGEAEQAQVSLARYRAVLAANDAGIGRLRAAVAADAQMAGRALFLVVADRGRNEQPDASGSLGADDESAQRGRVALVAAGPGLKRRASVRVERTLEDVTPTLARLLGAEAVHADGRVWTDVLANP